MLPVHHDDILFIPSPEQVDPFIVRAHHAQNLSSMLVLGQSPVELATDVYDLPGKRTYRQDVYGTTEEEAGSAVDGMAEFFQTFLDLPDDAPVELAEGKKDGICNSCVIGEHCARLGSADYKWIQAVRETAGELGLAGTIVEVEDISAANDNARTFQSIVMPASTARLVLSESKCYDRALSGPISRATRHLAGKIGLKN